LEELQAEVVVGCQHVVAVSRGVTKWNMSRIMPWVEARVLHKQEIVATASRGRSISSRASVPGEVTPSEASQSLEARRTTLVSNRMTIVPDSHDPHARDDPSNNAAQRKYLCVLLQLFYCLSSSCSASFSTSALMCFTLQDIYAMRCFLFQGIYPSYIPNVYS